MRSGIADIFDKALPMPPVSGPPLPQGFSIRWPAELRYKMPRPVHQIDSMYLNTKTKISSVIRGF